MGRDFESLSGGEQTKIRLLRLMLSKFDFLILDEPSNHLDKNARIWLANWIAKQDGILVVSHDRLLLSQANRIYEMTTKGIQKYSGNYESYKTSAEQIRKGKERESVLAKKAKKKAQLNITVSMAGV